MAVAPDLITHKTLILIKQIYQHAATQSASLHSDVDRILSLISFDLANETLIKNAITAVDSKVKSIPTELDKMIQLADEVFAKANPPIPSLPDTLKIKRVRRFRNGAMHEAKYPTSTDISDCRTYTRDFLQQTILNVWNEDFSSIKLTDLIRHSEVKTFVTNAESELEAGNYTDAVTEAIAGMEIAMGSVKHSLVGGMPSSAHALMLDDGREQKPSRKAYRTLVKVRDIVAHLAVGVDVQSFIQFERLTRYINVYYLGDGKISSTLTGPESDADDAAFVVNYVVNAVIQIESLVGDISKPFGEHSR